MSLRASPFQLGLSTDVDFRQALAVALAGDFLQVFDGDRIGGPAALR